MNPSGLWKGKTGGKVGNFKFINVELLPEKPSGSGRPNRNRSHSRGRGVSQSASRRAGSPVSAKGPEDGNKERGRVRRKRKSQNRRRVSAATMVNGGSSNNVLGGSSGNGLAGESKPKTVDELLRRLGLEVIMSFRHH